MGLKSLVLITLVAGFVLTSAQTTASTDQTKDDADALLQTQKVNAALAGYTLLRGLIIDSNGQAVSSTDTDFALKLTETEMTAIADAFASDNFGSFNATGVDAEGVNYQMAAKHENGAVSAIANGKILHMLEVSFGISALLLEKNE